MARSNKKKLSRKRTTSKSKKPHKHTKKQNKRLKQHKKTKTRKTKRKTRQSKRKSRKLKGGNVFETTKYNPLFKEESTKQQLPLLKKNTDGDNTNATFYFEYNNNKYFIKFKYTTKTMDNINISSINIFNDKYIKFLKIGDEFMYNNDIELLDIIEQYIKKKIDIKKFNNKLINLLSRYIL